MFPKLNNLTQNERDEFDDLVIIVQNITGITWIANNGIVMMSDECKMMTTRMRHLLIKNMELEELKPVTSFTTVCTGKDCPLC